MLMRASRSTRSYNNNDNCAVASVNTEVYSHGATTIVAAATVQQSCGMLIVVVAVCVCRGVRGTMYMQQSTDASSILHTPSILGVSSVFRTASSIAVLTAEILRVLAV